MPEKEVLGQGVIELLLDMSKLKPALAAAQKLLDSVMGGGGAGGGGGGKGRGRQNRGILAGLANHAAKEGARAGKALSKGLSLGVIEATKATTVLVKSLSNISQQASKSAAIMARDFIKATESAAKAGAKAFSSMATNIAKSTASAANAGVKAASTMFKDWSRAGTRISKSGAKAAGSIATDMGGAASKISKSFGRAITAVTKRVDGYSKEFGKVSRSSRRSSRSVQRDVQQAGRQVGVTRRAVDRLGNSFRGAGRAGMGFGKTMAAVAGGNVIANLLNKVAIGLKNIATAGFKTSASMETLEISFSQLVGGNEKAKALLSTLREFSAATPIQFIDASKAATALLTTKQIAESELIPTIKKLTDVAAGSAIGFQAFPRIVKAITDSLGKARIQSQEMIQLAEAGVPAWSILADAMGKSIAETRKLAEAGKLGLDEINILIDALGDKYEGLAKKQSQTFLGLMSTLRDQVGRFSSDITKPFFDLAKIKLKNLTEWIRTDEATKFFDTIKNGISRAAKLVEAGLNSPLLKTIVTIGGLGLATMGLAPIFKATFGILLSVISPVRLAILGLTSLFFKAQESFKKALDSPAGKKIRETLQEIKDLAIEIGTNVADIVTDGWNNVKDVFADVFNIDDMNDFWTKGTAFVRDFLDEISLFTSNWRAAWDLMFNFGKLQLQRMNDQFKKFSEAFSEGFLFAIGAVVGGFKAFVSQVIAFLAEIGNAVVATGAGISGVFKKIFSDPKTFFSATALTKAFSDSFTDAFKGQKDIDFVGFREAMQKEGKAFSGLIAGMAEDAQAGRDKAIQETEKKIQDAIDRLQKAREKKRKERAEKAAKDEAVEVEVKKDDKKDDKLNKNLEDLADAMSTTDLVGLQGTIQGGLKAAGEPIVAIGKQLAGVLGRIDKAVRVAEGDQREGGDLGKVIDKLVAGFDDPFAPVGSPDARRMEAAGPPTVADQLNQLFPGLDASSALRQMGSTAPMGDDSNASVNVQKQVLGELKKQSNDDRLLRAFEVTGETIVNNMGFGK